MLPDLNLTSYNGAKLLKFHVTRVPLKNNHKKKIYNSTHCSLNTTTIPKLPAMATKKNLSKHVLQMKFMKRTKESEDLKRFEDEGRAFFQDAAASVDPDGKGANIIIQHNWYVTENLMLGRYSFNGMNPNIEEIMKSYCNFGDSDDVKPNLEDMDVDVSAQRFARNIKRNKFKKQNVKEFLDQQHEERNCDSSLVQTMASKFVKGQKRKKGVGSDEERGVKKSKFLKPEAD